MPHLRTAPQALPDGGIIDPAGSTLALVGNAPGTGGAARIDAAAHVVRFNNAAGFGGAAGSRVTHLALVNRGGQPGEWLADDRFWTRPVMQQAQGFILPFPMLPEAHNRPVTICWTRAILARLRPLGRPVHILPEALHDHARALLGPGPEGPANPSTGFLVTLALLLARPAEAPPAQAHGFGFAGWPGHPWAAERAWFADAEREGRLVLHPPEGDAPCPP